MFVSEVFVAAAALFALLPVGASVSVCAAFGVVAAAEFGLLRPRLFRGFAAAACLAVLLAIALVTVRRIFLAERPLALFALFVAERFIAVFCSFFAERPLAASALLVAEGSAAASLFLVS